MNFLLKFFATGFGSGYSPIAPGTAGALVAVLIHWCLHYFFPSPFSGSFPTSFWLIGLTLAFFIIGILTANSLEKDWGQDAQKIVIDEMVGVWIAMIFIPFSLLNLFLAFILFRVFDIWKPLGIRKMEKLRGGWGVMMDDVLAGIYANLVLQVLIYLEI